MKISFCGIFLIAFCLADSSTAQSVMPPTADLKREADQVLAIPDNVAQRAGIAPVFKLAEQYAAAGKTNEALSYYLKGLEHQPWNLDAQLAVARLLRSTGDTNGAQQKAELVWKYAETDALLAGAAELLGKPFDLQLPKSEPWPKDSFALALVAYGNVDAWLLLELRADLPKLLGIPVIIRQLPLDLPKPGREPLHLRAEDLRKRIATSRQDPRFELLVNKLNLETNSLSTDMEVFAFAEAVLNSETNKEPARQFREELALLRRLGPQWDANELVTRVGTAFAAKPGSERGYLAVTPVDLYANDSRYLFGLAAIGANCGVFSYHRFTSAIVADPPNRDRLKERALKQALSSVGLMFGLPRCTDPTCARAYPNSLNEFDAKQLKLCLQCQEGFAKRFGKKAE